MLIESKSNTAMQLYTKPVATMLPSGDSHRGGASGIEVIRRALGNAPSDAKSGLSGPAWTRSADPRTNPTTNAGNATNVDATVLVALLIGVVPLLMC